MNTTEEKPQQINDLAYGRLVSSGDFGVNGARTVSKSDTPLTQPCSLPVLIGALARARPGHPREYLVTLLIEQCKNFERDRRPTMRPKILRTIEAIERAAYAAGERRWV